MFNKNETKSKKWRISFGLIGVFLLAIVASGCESEPTQTNILGVGENGIINNNSDKNDTSGVAILAMNEKILDDFIQTQIADDKIGFQLMTDKRELFTVKNGTKVKVIDLKFLGKTEVRILERDYLEKSGWIASEFVISE